MKPHVFILMGVSATGKTTLGNALAEATGGAFYDGDDFHPESNRKKMSSGHALNDEDRRPWLEILAQLIADKESDPFPSFIACSALKESYREILRSKAQNLAFLLLDSDPEILRKRITERYEAGLHFMPPSLLDSQLNTLERPSYALLCDVSLPLEDLISLFMKEHSHLLNHTI